MNRVVISVISIAVIAVGMALKSEFASMPGFGAFGSGKIVLQDHGDEVWYRNIMIRKL